MTQANAPVETARAHVGTGEYGEDKVGRDPVNLPMIHHWVQVFEDQNPVYVDDELAARTRHGGLVAPPAMLQTWTMDAPNKDAQGGPQDAVMVALAEAGYTSVVAVNYDHEYLRELRLDERITQRSTIEDMSAEKQTALGHGFFVTARHDYVTDDGELVGIGRMRLLRFRPPEKTASTVPDDRRGRPRPAPAINRDNAHLWEGINAGELRIQRCTGCGALRHPPRPMCGECRSIQWTPVVAGGGGTIHSFVVHHHPPMPQVDAPHPVVLVDLDEGVRLVAQMTRDTDPEAVAIGQRVRLDFEQINDDLTVPAFALVQDERGAA